MIGLAGGRFSMGSEPGEGYPEDGEGPSHQVTLPPFSISPVTVTNADFSSFADATGYRTVAELDGWSFVFGGLLPEDFPDTSGVADFFTT